jgi:hypothetical protein
MDRPGILLELARQVGAAGAAQDWDALAQLNGVMATTLAAMLAQGPLPPAERAALGTLRQAHLQAVHVAGLASAELAQKMNELQTNKEGWMAYAMSNTDQETSQRNDAADIGTTV